MTIYTHWINDEVKGSYNREFFGRKSEQEAAAKAATALGHNVIAVHDWQVAPTAEAVADFINGHCAQCCPTDLVEHFVNTEILGA